MEPCAKAQEFRREKEQEEAGILEPKVIRSAAARPLAEHLGEYMWNTFFQRHGVARRFAMKLLRHSNIKLTSKVYTDETQLPIYEAVKDLPRLMGYTQIRAQISGAERQNGSQAVATNRENQLSQPAGNELASRK